MTIRTWKRRNKSLVLDPTIFGKKVRSGTIRGIRLRLTFLLFAQNRGGMSNVLAHGEGRLF